MLRHLAFVQPRFESFVAPRRRYICLLQAIVMLLAATAGDMRNQKQQRARAEAALDAITPPDVLANGLAADFGEQCMAFLRLFDVDDHDPALTSGQKDNFVDTLRILFTQGYIYCNADDGAIPQLAAGSSLPVVAPACEAAVASAGNGVTVPAGTAVAAPASRAHNPAIAPTGRAVAAPASSAVAVASSALLVPARRAAATSASSPVAAARSAVVAPAHRGLTASASSAAAASALGAAEASASSGVAPPANASPAAFPQTLTQIAMAQMSDLRVFYYGDKTKVLWSKTAACEAAAVLKSMQEVVDATCSRLEADFYHADMLMALQIFDLATWASVKEQQRENAGLAKLRQKRLASWTRALARALHLPPADVVEQLGRALPVATREKGRLQRLTGMSPPIDAAVLAVAPGCTVA